MPVRSNTATIMSETKKPVRKPTKPGRKTKTPAETETAPAYEPNVPVPTCRAELLKYWMNFTLDDRTANKMLWISEGGAKVTRRNKEVCPVLDRAERYDYSPQVLCKEGIWNTRGYWEVEYSGWVVVGITCEGATRRAQSGPSGLGENEDSWALGWSGTCYQIWHNGNYTDIRDMPRCSTIGVYVDQPAGVMNFYLVVGDGAEEGGAGKEVRLLHSNHAPLKEKILPGFWCGIQSSCTLLKKPQ